jgi:hypothetical protein
MSMSVSNDSSAAAWQAQAMAAAEAYLDLLDEAAYQAQLQAQLLAQNGSTGAHLQDGLDTPSAQQRAHDSFYANDPNRPPETTFTIPSGATVLRPEDVQVHLDNGFTVLQNAQGQFYIPPDESIVVVQAPNASSLPGPGHSGPSTVPALNPTSTSPSATTTDWIVDPITEPDKMREPEEIRTGFGEKVDGLLNASTALRRRWEQAEADGWKIRLAAGDKRSQADPGSKTIWINPAGIADKKNFDTHMAALIAHEMGHAVTQYEPRFESDSRAAFVSENTERSLRHEGAAAFENARARDEIKTATGTDIGIRGGYDQAYIDIYEQYKSGAITETEAKSRMTDIQAIEPESFNGSSITTRQQAFATSYGEQWDKDHPGE